MSHVLEREKVLGVDCQSERKVRESRSIMYLDRSRLSQDCEVIQSSHGKK